MSDDCVFCKIVAGELPATKICEDDDVLAFLDIGPVVKGHTLVIPKAHYATIMDVPVELLQKVIAVAKTIAEAQTAGLKAEGVNVGQANGRVANQIVPHMHFHVIPRFEADGHSFSWTPKKYDGPAEMQAFAGKITGAL
ncbi:MAG: HIT family protein [Kiritimatiellae bacterium]|nr:HIT family protein [Kiritimatiellia bacterium]